MRRQYITHSRFQFIFTLSFVVGALLMFTILGGATLLTIKLFLSEPGLTQSQSNLLSHCFIDMSHFLIYLTVFSLLLFIWLGLYLSYKFVGPLYRLEEWLSDRVAKKEFSPLVLRPGDELEPIVRILNRMCEKKQEDHHG